MTSINCEQNENSIVNPNKSNNIKQNCIDQSLFQYMYKSLQDGSQIQQKQEEFNRKSLNFGLQQRQITNIFDKEEIKVNLKKNKQVKMSGMHIRVFFFELKQFRQFEIGQFSITTSVRQFIDYSIHSFLYSKYNFIPEKINFDSYQIKLLKQNDQPYSQKIEYHHEIAQYFCQNLIIFRKKTKNSNLKRFIHLCPDYLVYEIHVPHKKSRHILKIIKNSTYSQLKSQILKLCKQERSENFVLLTYHKMKLIIQSQMINQTHQKEIELIKIQAVDFNTYKNQIYPLNEVIKTSNLNPFNKSSKIQIQLDLGIFQGKIKLSIESQYIIQRYYKSRIEKIMQIFSSNVQQKKYLIKDLESAYLEDNYLVLKFSNETKRYQMRKSSQKECLLQIIRQFRLLKRNLSQQEQY